MHTDGKLFDFNIFRRLGDFIRNVYFDDISLKQAINRQEEIEVLIRDLDYYKPRNPDKVESRKEVLKNAQKFFYGRNLALFAIEENTFSLPKEEMPQHEKWKEEKDQKSNDKFYVQEEIATDMTDFESEESAEQRRNKKGQGLKILTLNQMLSRLPMSLAQLFRKTCQKN